MYHWELQLIFLRFERFERALSIFLSAKVSTKFDCFQVIKSNLSDLRECNLCKLLLIASNRYELLLIVVNSY